MKNKIIILILSLIVLLILIDQISKIVVQNKYEAPVEYGIVSINIIENTGMAFGSNKGNTKNIVMTVLVLLLVINFVRKQIKVIDKKTAVAVSLVLAGGFSNLIDRIARGAVIDFIKVRNFAVFNIADCYVVIGWILIVIYLILFGISNSSVLIKRR